MPSDDQFRERTLARFEEHRRAWDRNPALRALYERWYARVREALPARALGPWIELGSGPGFARGFIPELELSDIVKAPWHDHQVAAETLPWAPGSVGALVLFDVLHHLRAPAGFFAEATRVLRPGGRIVLCEPYMSALSHPIYKYFHAEGADMNVDPFAEARVADKDPFEGKQAVPTLLLGRYRSAFEQHFPELRITSVEHMAGISYLASGGFSRQPLLPLPVWHVLRAFEDKLPESVFRALGFRLLATVEKRGEKT